MSKKIVRFYRPELVDGSGVRSSFQASFWRNARDLMEDLENKDREIGHNGARYYGDQGVGQAPAMPYIRVGRIRRRGEWPNTVDDTYDVQPLRLRGRRNLFEAAYLVPFGALNQVAVMGPMRGMVSVSAIERWLTVVLGLVEDGDSLELLPELDPNVVNKLSQAEGLSRLTVKIPYDTELDLPARTGGQIGSAIAAATAAQSDQLDMEMTFSFGNRKPAGMAEELLNVARSLHRTGAPSKLEVSMLLPTDTGFKVEQHDLVKDLITKLAAFDVDEDEDLATDQILKGIAGAIQEFRQL